MSAMAFQITSLTIIYSIVYSGTDQRKHQSSASLAFVRGIHRWPVNFPHKGPVTRKMLPFDDVIMSRLSARPSTGEHFVSTYIIYISIDCFNSCYQWPPITCNFQVLWSRVLHSIIIFLRIKWSAQVSLELMRSRFRGNHSCTCVIVAWVIYVN